MTADLHIDNKPGATAMIVTAIVNNTPANGHTPLHGATSDLAANPASASR